MNQETVMPEAEAEKERILNLRTLEDVRHYMQLKYERQRYMIRELV